MAKTDPVDPNVPPNSESPTLGAQRIRELARAVAEILNIDHYIGSDAGSGYAEDAAGEHSIVTGRAAGSIVTPGSGKMRLGFKTISGATELFTRDDAANEKQITNKGKINILDADGAVVKTGNQTIAGIKTFSSSPVVPAPTTDLQASTKKYVDDQDVDGTPTKVLTKYLTGTLDADTSTSVAHGVTGIDNILSVTVCAFNDVSGAYTVADYLGGEQVAARFSYSFNATNVVLSSVGANVQGNKYRIRIDYR